MKDFNSYNPENYYSTDTDTWLAACAGLCNMDGTPIHINGAPVSPHDRPPRKLKIRTISKKRREKYYG